MHHTPVDIVTFYTYPELTPRKDDTGTEQDTNKTLSDLAIEAIIARLRPRPQLDFREFRHFLEGAMVPPKRSVASPDRTKKTSAAF
jgi:hypothetical protein